MIDEQEFEDNQKSLCELKNNILAISQYCRGDHWLNNSEMQNWTDKVAFIYDHRDMIEQIASFSPEELSAYHVLQQLLPALDVESKKTQYNYFSEILEILIVHSSDKKRLLEEYLENENSDTILDRHLLQDRLQEELEKADQYLKKRLQEYCYGEKIPVSIEQDLLEQIKQLHDTYPAVKGLICSIEGWGHPLQKETPLTEVDLCRKVAKDSIKCRSMAFVLEHIANAEKKRAKSKGKDITLNYLERNLPLELVQNRIVTAGLYFGEKRHPFFGFGSMFMVSQILETPLEDILAWSIVSRIAQKLHQSVLAENNSIESTHTQDISQDFNVIRNIIQKHQSDLSDQDMNVFIMNFLVECSIYLKDIKVKRGFDGVDIFKWMLDINDLVTLYYSCRQQLARRSTPEYIKQARDFKKKKIGLLGDSSSACLGTKDQDKDKRWPAVLESELSKEFFDIIEPVVINFSVAGYGTQEGEEALPGIFRSFPDLSALILIQVGNCGIMRREISAVKDSVCRIVEISENNGISACNIIWGAGLPETLDVESNFRNGLPNCMKEVIEKTGAKGVLLPTGLLTADKMSYDNVHFGIEVQEGIAKFAFEPVQSILRLQLREKAGRSFESETASNLSLTPYFNAKNKGQGAGVSSLEESKPKPFSGAGSKR